MCGSDREHSNSITHEAETFLPTFSDDLDALHEQETELVIQRNRQGIVIQHRSWGAGEAFRSEDDRSFGRLFAVFTRITV